MDTASGIPGGAILSAYDPPVAMGPGNGDIKCARDMAPVGTVTAEPPLEAGSQSSPTVLQDAPATLRMLISRSTEHHVRTTRIMRRLVPIAVPRL
ncbi:MULTISPECIES: hypothetical protein [Streptosporangium]|uniref:DUF305 domain-containing protein n=1 Tax=Streptosporangium brasiliense TaxID=47480 RepID=A0ABT9RI23_9ACTN|nr:hypothetical protein [Streptosporangium brasiliense]MDP9867995.1 hypothetical protein [Streptosporangium brasiliense]